MISFKQYLNETYTILTEKVLSIGLNPEHEKFREKYRTQIHDIIHTSYVKAGGYGGLASGSKAESDAINADIDSSLIKATRRGDVITSVNLYKKAHGRKSIASGTNGTPQGKIDYMKGKLEDHEQQRAWGEVSGAAEHIQRKLGAPVIKSARAKELLNKDVVAHTDTEHYNRKIGPDMHTKIMMGHPKKN